jgi:hypothetical protein
MVDCAIPVSHEIERYVPLLYMNSSIIQ